MQKQAEEVLNGFKTTAPFSFFPSLPPATQTLSTTIICGKASVYLEENASGEIGMHCLGR